MKKFIIITAVIIGTVCNLYSCSCRDIPSFYWRYNFSDKVFKGQVIAVKAPEDDRSNFMTGKRTLFRVIAKYKGEIPNDTISITTGLGHGDCGLLADTNDVWIIFSENGYTNICSSNFLVSRGGKEQYRLKTEEGKSFLKLLDEVVSGKNRYVKDYDSKGQLLAEGQMTNGIAEGYWEYYFKEEEGALFEMPTRTRVFFRNGIKDSLEYEYFKNGKLYSEQSWHKGKENGKKIIYNSDGSISASENFVEGKKDGKWESYYENGKHYDIEYYSMDKPVKAHTHFYDNGDTCYASYFDDTGRRINGWMKYENGKFQSIDTYHQVGDLNIEESIYYYENGNVKSKSSGYRDNKWKYHGEQIRYYENGNVKEKTYYEKGKEVGTWYYYDETGKLIGTENK